MDLHAMTRLLLPILAVYIALATGIRIFFRMPEHGHGRRPWTLFLALTVFGLLLALCITQDQWISDPITPMLFLGFWVVQWFIFMLAGRNGMKAELVGFFLSDLGLMVAALSDSSALHTQLISVALGIVGFYFLRLILRSPEFAQKLRIPCAVCCLGLLSVCLVFSHSVNDSLSWITLFGVSFQPSEIAKVFFVLAVALPETHRAPKKDVILVTVFSAVCVLLLVAANDLGSAVVFFSGFLAGAAMRKYGYLASGAGLCGAAGGSLLVIRLGGRAAGRFATWGKAWEYMNDSGYQQTRTMAAIASGGFFGIGIGKGWLRDVYAANTDMVFGVVCEEAGILVGCCAILLIWLLSVQAVWAARCGRSPLLVSCACVSSMLLLVQTTLNTLGSVDIVPFTGVTFPLVSVGGTSAMACWWLMAFTGTDTLPAFRPRTFDTESDPTIGDIVTDQEAPL